MFYIYNRECVPEYCANSSLQDDVLSGNPGFCDNTAITLQRFPKTEVFETADRGYGLRLLVAVPADTIVAEYMGEVISNDAMWQRMKTYQATDDFYFANLGGGLTLDASSMGSLARFANHSCDPTCIMQRWTVKGEPRIVLAALRDLPAGSEVTYCYNFEDDDFANNPVKHQVCRCGAKYCSGKVGKGAATRDADLQSLVDKVKSYSEGSKSGSLETLAELLEQMQKHKSNHIELATSCENLANIISQANGWLDDCQQLMATAKSQLVDITEVTSLLDRSPTCLRSDFKKQLKAMSTAYEEVQGFVSKLLANSFVHWDDFLELCKLLNSAHPVNCKVAVDFLFGAYLPCLQWCAEHVAPFTTCLEEIVSKTAGEGISQHRSNYFSVLKKLMKAYYHDSTLLPDLLTFSVSQLNDRLSDFMKVHYSSKNKAKKDQDEESEVVVCYCQTLESAGDQTVCVQCSTCDQWFHPACMNFPTAYTASMRKQDNFYCAACSFKVGLLSNFVFPPNSEWGTVKLKKKAVQSVASGNHAKSNATSEPLVPLQKLHLAPTAVVKAEGDVAHSSALFDPAAPVAVAPENPLLVALDRLIAQRQHMQHKQFLRKEDINIALRQAESLQLRNVGIMQFYLLVSFVLPICNVLFLLLDRIPCLSS
ncbi:SET domain-containing protein-lysine N-methyltransferase [archaeon]|nr:MAG: SET domain-containing protein-lysine N-methyltransferase [archaeon]